jgi:DNA-binding transcriptional regulator YhcF (GntR family)
VRSKVVVFEQIRRDSRVDGLSVRELASKHGVHRRTVRQALVSPTPPESVPRRWRVHKIDPFIDAIDEMLRADGTAPRKQRHTTTRILARLVAEHDGAGLSYSTVHGWTATPGSWSATVNTRSGPVRRPPCAGAAALQRGARYGRSHPDRAP